MLIPGTKETKERRNGLGWEERGEGGGGGRGGGNNFYILFDETVIMEAEVSGKKEDVTRETLG